MKTTSYIFEKMRQHLHSEDFLNRNRIGPKAFLRRRLLPFSVIFLFIFNLLRNSIPKEQIAFCKNCEVKGNFSRAAVTKARAKLSSKAFIEMNHILLKEFYTDNPFKRFHGLITMAIDGSTVELPTDSPEILQKYGCATNQTKSEVPMARISTLFDVVNGITWDANIAPYDSSERVMAIQHFEAIRSLKMDYKQLLVIFDRGYPSLALMVYLLENGINFLMRTGSQFLKEVNDVVKKRKRDTIIQISLKRATRAARAELKELFPDINFNRTISIRIVVVTLSTGEKEVLITSLLDKEKYPYKIFRELYFKRWGTEENYKFFKVCLEVENFSGKSCIAIEQDFHSTVLAANSRALLALEAIQEINCDENISVHSKPRKYIYAINKKVAMEALKHDFVGALLDPDISMERFCKGVKSIMKQNLVPIRPGRSFRRVRKHPHRKYHMNLR
jgi:Transposase DDE domain